MAGEAGTEGSNSDWQIEDARERQPHPYKKQTARIGHPEALHLPFISSA